MDAAMDTTGDFETGAGAGAVAGSGDGTAGPGNADGAETGADTDTGADALLSIGEFARLSRLSPKALRLYDDSGLLVPARVDPGSGYRWYSPGQLEHAQLVAALRRVGMPLARIRALGDADGADAAGAVARYWAGVEAEHAARRALTGLLVDRLQGRWSAMDDVSIRDVPERSMLCLLRHVRPQELLEVGRGFLLPLRAAAPRLPGVAGGAPFVVYLGEVSEDGDGPIEWCWPLPADQAESTAAQFPHLTLRTLGAYQEAFVPMGPALHVGPDRSALAMERLISWAQRQGRQHAGAPRQLFVHNPANGGTGPDCEFAIALR
jgi:DNA-binding transcriptional MerR regulator